MVPLVIPAASPLGRSWMEPWARRRYSRQELRILHGGGRPAAWRCTTRRLFARAGAGDAGDRPVSASSWNDVGRARRTRRAQRRRACWEAQRTRPLAGCWGVQLLVSRAAGSSGPATPWVPPDPEDAGDTGLGRLRPRGRRRLAASGPVPGAELLTVHSAGGEDVGMTVSLPRALAAARGPQISGAFLAAATPPAAPSSELESGLGAESTEFLCNPHGALARYRFTHSSARLTAPRGSLRGSREELGTTLTGLLEQSARLDRSARSVPRIPPDGH